MPETLDPECFVKGETIPRGGRLEWLKAAHLTSSPLKVSGSVTVTPSATVPARMFLDFAPILRCLNYGSRPLGEPEAKDALHWRVLEHIRTHPGTRVEQLAEALGISDILAFDVVGELRARGFVGPA